MTLVCSVITIVDLLLVGNTSEGITLAGVSAFDFLPRCFFGSSPRRITLKSSLTSKPNALDRAFN